MEVTFRRMTDGDLGLLHQWLNEPGVVRWWEGDDVSWEGVVGDYGFDHTDPYLEHWLGLVDGEPVGWIQCYAGIHEPEEFAPLFALGLDHDAAGIDYLIGEPARRHQGLGSAMIGAFVRDIVFGMHPGWTQACAAPHEANAPSLRALEKAGFRFLGAVTDADGVGHLMVIDRPG